MKTNIPSNYQGKPHIARIKCVVCFIALFSPALLLTMIMASHLLITQIMLAVTGWIAWTFIEYFAHRFWMHTTGKEYRKDAMGNHKHHHSHPTEIKITSFQRLLLLGILAALMVISFLLHNYFTLFTGFFSGFVSYCFMHAALHKRWAEKLFPNLYRFHVYHHCKYPDKCFGITSVWWDYLFKTIPSKNTIITARIKDFYFGEH